VGTISDLTVRSGGVLELAGHSQAFASISGKGTIQNTLGGPATLTLSNSAPDTFTGTITEGPANPLQLIKSVGGVLALTGATVSVPLTINAGTPPARRNWEGGSTCSRVGCPAPPSPS
jgi:hypothetical protein